MAKLSKDLAAGTLHPRENIFAAGTLGAVNATVSVPCDGSSSVAIDLRGTFSQTVQMQGTVDGSNWVAIPARPQTGGAFVASITGTTAGVWMASCAGFTTVRAIVTAYTSGSAACVLATSVAMFDDFARLGAITSTFGTATGASGAAVTLTLAAPGAGLRHYLTSITITRYAAAVLTASAAPVVVTSTNIPGSLAWTIPADAAALGTVATVREEMAYPVMATAQNTATTIVCPVTTGVIWRVSVGYFVAP